MLLLLFLQSRSIVVRESFEDNDLSKFPQKVVGESRNEKLCRSWKAIKLLIKTKTAKQLFLDCVCWWNLRIENDSKVEQILTFFCCCRCCWCCSANTYGEQKENRCVYNFISNNIGICWKRKSAPVRWRAHRKCGDLWSSGGCIKVTQSVGLCASESAYTWPTFRVLTSNVWRAQMLYFFWARGWHRKTDGNKEFNRKTVTEIYDY